MTRECWLGGCAGLKEGKKGRYLNRNCVEREKELKRLVFVFVCVGVCGRVNECF